MSAQPLKPAAADAYNGRESVSTRNPHTAGKKLTLKELAKLSTEDRVLAQWRAAYGTPISDEAKAQFSISACGHTFNLGDVRLWQDHHRGGAQKEPQIYLEFFFDGMLSEVAGKEDEWQKAFENMVETQLQEVRRNEFRKRLTARRRNVPKSASEDAEGGGDSYSVTDDQDWKEYLNRPVPATKLKIEAMREAGCMLRFLCCQTSISVSAAEVLGQISFMDQFPVDGEILTSKSSKPMPAWAYGLMVCTVGFSTVTAMVWWQVVKAAIARGGDAGEPLSLPA